MLSFFRATMLLLSLVVLFNAASAARPMENLGRGVVALRASGGVFVSWRLLGLDPSGIGFNLYRKSGSSAAVKVNSAVLTGGTNYLDTAADTGQQNEYYVRPVVNGAEQPASGSFRLKANSAEEPVFRVPLRAGNPIKFVWVGDLNGDGEYDYVVDRQGNPQTIEAYLNDGTFLWSASLGPNSANQNNIEPGSSTIDVGNWDGVTVYDFDNDGNAEVAIKIANGVVFGDGTTWSNSDNNKQWIAFLNGQTGALRAYVALPRDYAADGPLAARFGVGVLDGTTPHLVAFMKNRQDGGAFNLIECAYTFKGSNAVQKWCWRRDSQNAPDGHNTRIIDVDANGSDEVVEIGYCLNGDGSLRYSLGPSGIIHGDRFHIAKMDPSRAGLQGYGVQQDHPDFLYEYYYDARDGKILWKHFGSSTSDVGRGMAGDIDPRSAGMETWSFGGVYNAPSNELAEPDTSKAPWPSLGLWWDGDTLLEFYNDGKIEKWDWLKPSASNSLPRIESIWNYGATSSNGVYPQMIGDIIGDWREEVILTNSDYSQLVIFSTDIPTSTRLYTLPHNPAYRNCMTLKGYQQSNHVDYFMGSGMSTPPQPNIYYV
ncbi:hypothetical protein V2G26_007907 [Clonostachys chloroleuca]